MRLLLVANPGAGSSDKAERDRLLGALGRAGRVDVLEPSSPTAYEAEVQRAAGGAEMIVVVGGDGSMSLAVNALGRRLDDHVLGLIPAGTGNDLARTLGIPTDPEEAAESVVSGSTRAIDIGRATGAGADRLFVNACMGGFPVQVDEAVTPEMKERLGPAAFIAGGLKAVADLDTTTVRLDGITIPDCVAVGVGNGRTCGGGIEVWPDADPSDGSLDACALPAKGLSEALRLAVKVKTGSHRDMSGVTCIQSPEVRVEADPSIELNVDGELVGLRTPVTFTVEGTFRVRVPA